MKLDLRTTKQKVLEIIFKIGRFFNLLIFRYSARALLFVLHLILKILGIVFAIPVAIFMFLLDCVRAIGRNIDYVLSAVRDSLNRIFKQEK